MARPAEALGDSEGLSVDRLVAATIGLLDESGLQAFSMRTLASRLGRSQMAAYRHVRSREELLLLAAREVESQVPDVGDGPWYEQLEVVIRHGWETTWSPHPWIVDLMHSGAFPVSSSGRIEMMQGLYRAAGFEGDRLERALVAHWSFVVGTLTVISAMRDTGTSGADEVFEFNLRTYVSGIRAVADRIG